MLTITQGKVEITHWERECLFPPRSHVNCLDSSSRRPGTPHTRSDHRTRSPSPALQVTATRNTVQCRNPRWKALGSGVGVAQALQIFWDLSLLEPQYSESGIYPEDTWPNFPSYLVAHFLPFHTAGAHQCEHSTPAGHRPPNSTLKASFAWAKTHRLCPFLFFLCLTGKVVGPSTGISLRSSSSFGSFAAYLLSCRLESPHRERGRRKKQVALLPSCS